MVVEHGVLARRYGALGFVKVDVRPAAVVQRHGYALFALAIAELCAAGKCG